MFEFKHVKPLPDGGFQNISVFKTFHPPNRRKQAEALIGKEVRHIFTDVILIGRISEVEDLGYGQFELIVKDIYCQKKKNKEPP